MATIARRILSCQIFTRSIALRAYSDTIYNRNKREEDCKRGAVFKSYNNLSNECFCKRFMSTEAPNETLTIQLSEKCIKQLNKITAEDKDTFLRVMVEGGGCSGFQYTFNLDKTQQDDDRVFEKDGAKVIIDETSLEILNGSTIDYHEELIRSAFRVIDNPKAEMGCSCGVSFSLKI